MSREALSGTQQQQQLVWTWMGDRQGRPTDRCEPVNLYPLVGVDHNLHVADRLYSIIVLTYYIDAKWIKQSLVWIRNKKSGKSKMVIKTGSIDMKRPDGSSIAITQGPSESCTQWSSQGLGPQDQGLYSQDRGKTKDFLINWKQQ